jgi:hypothetical protein
MSKRQAKVDKGLSAQTGLFDTALSEGELEISLGFRQCLSRAISQAASQLGKDRYQIAAEISRLMARDLTKEMLDKYTSSAPEYRYPAEGLTAFCHVVGSYDPFRYLLEPLNMDILKPEDRDLIQLARLQEQQRQIEAEIARIRTKRGIK